jgi:hypothetical protein
MTLCCKFNRRFPAFFAISFFLVASFANAADTPIAPRGVWKTSRIQGTPEPPEPYRIVPSFPKLKFERPTSIEQITGSNRLLITEMNGKIFSFPQRCRHRKGRSSRRPACHTHRRKCQKERLAVRRRTPSQIPRKPLRVCLLRSSGQRQSHACLAFHHDERPRAATCARQRKGDDHLPRRRP